MTPSAVSHQIKTLEEQLRATLFERRTRQILLTEVGAALFTQIDPLIRDLDVVTSRLLGRAERRRVLRIGLLPFFASEMFIPRLSRFAEQHPSIYIRIETADAGTQHLHNSDASIVLLSEPPAGVQAHPLFWLKLAPACSPQIGRDIGTGDPRRLLESTLIVHKSRPNAWNDWFAHVGIDVKEQPRIIHLDSMFSVARAAERGLGIALVPVPLSENWFRSGALVRPCAGELETTDCYYLAYRFEDAGNPDVVALRDWVIDTFACADEEMSAVA